MPDGNPRKLLDSSKIKSYGWSPEINLDEGLVISLQVVQRTDLVFPSF